jgi:hypothetical protein
MSPVVTTDTDLVDTAVDDTALDDTALDEIAALERAWHGPDHIAEKSISKINSATLTVTRNSASDFQDRQVFLYVDGELWGKVKYGRPVTREIPPGHHRVRAFNTLFSHTIEIDAKPGEHVRLNCTNGLPRGGFLMLLFLHVTALRVRLERE